MKNNAHKKTRMFFKITSVCLSFQGSGSLDDDVDKSNYIGENELSEEKKAQTIHQSSM